jgi:hypothetical protein
MVPAPARFAKENPGLEPPGDDDVRGEGHLDAFAAVSFVLVDAFESGDMSFWSAATP